MIESNIRRVVIFKKVVQDGFAKQVKFEKIEGMNGDKSSGPLRKEGSRSSE